MEKVPEKGGHDLYAMVEVKTQPSNVMRPKPSITLMMISNPSSWLTSQGAIILKIKRSSKLLVFLFVVKEAASNFLSLKCLLLYNRKDSLSRAPHTTEVRENFCGEGLDPLDL